MVLASLAGLRYRNSLTVSTPTSHNSPAYSLPIPLIRSLSARLAQRRSRFSSSSVFVARSLRPFGLFAASSSFSVVLIMFFFIFVFFLFFFASVFFFFLFTLYFI